MSVHKGKFDDDFDNYVVDQLRGYDSCLADTLDRSPAWLEAKRLHPPPDDSYRLAPGPLGHATALMHVPFPVFNAAYRECEDWDRLVSSLYALNLRNYYALFGAD